MTNQPAQPIEQNEFAYQGHYQTGAASSFLGIDLRWLFNEIKLNIVWIAAIVGGFLALGLLVTLLTVPKYVAVSKIMVEQEADQIIEGAELLPKQDSWDADRFLQTQVNLLQSRTVAARVVSELKLAEDAAFFDAMGSVLPTAEDLPDLQQSPDALAKYRRDEAIAQIMEHRNIVLEQDSRIISIGCKSTNPELSAKICNAYAEVFSNANLNRKFESSAYARKFLADQLESAKAKLEASERDLNQYSRAAGLIRVTGDKEAGGGSSDTTLSITNDALVQLNAAAGQATADRIQAEERWQAIARQSPLSIPAVLENEAVKQILSEKADAEAQLASERTSRQSDYPTIKMLNNKIAEYDARIQSIGNSIKRSIQIDYEAAVARENSLKANVETLRGDALNEQDRGVQYNVLKRVADTNRALYDSLLERFNQLNAAAGSASNNVTIVDRAEVPTEPSSPVLVLNLALAFLLGLGAAAVFVFLRNYFDDTIRNPADIDRLYGLPLIGLVPQEESAEESLANEKSALNEAYHTLVTNLQYSTSGGIPKILMVTSARESEGKTTTSRAVARDIARRGKNTLLIDADLRRPTLHSHAQQKERAGLTEVIVGNLTLDQAVFFSGHENLSYLTALPIPPDPSILLGGARLEEVLREAAARYDVVVVDSAPLLGLSDAASLAAHADGTLLVMSSQGFNRGAVRTALARLRLINANIVGAVVTKFDAKAAGGEYEYYGYNYYSYGKD